MTCYLVWSIPLGKRFFLFSWLRFIPEFQVVSEADWVIKFCLDVTLPGTTPQSNYLRWCEWHETCLLNCSNIRKSVVVWELGPPLQLIWGATTCPHSAGNQMSLRYLVKNTSKNPRPHQKFTIKGFFVEKVFLALATSRISFLSLTNLETFLSFPLLGWYGRKVTDLSHHQPSAWLTNQICPSLTVLCLITPNNLPVTSNRKWQ